MNEDIEFLQNFLDCDRYRIAELINSVSSAMQQLGHLLRQRAEGPFTVFFYNEDDPVYELIQLLDGNNFEVKYDFSIIGLNTAKVTPLYMETIEVEYVQEQPTTTNFDTYNEYNCEWTPDPLEETRNPPRRGLRAKTSLIDDISFDEKLFDKFLEPP